MKEAMWGLGLIMLCLLVFVIVGVISNISLTNQQDYYGVKQTTEASAYDAVEMVEYKSGVCLCTNTTPNSSGTRVFSSTVEYALKDVDKETNTCPEDPNYSHCDLLLGEYIIDPDVFTESVIARLGSIIKPSEIYDITVQEVIKYPPKVSVNIEFKQALNIEGEDRINQIIPNKFDGIFEETGESSILTYADNKIDDWPLTCDGKTATTTDETTQETTQETTTTTQQQGGCKACYWYYLGGPVQCGTASAHEVKGSVPASSKTKFKSSSAATSDCTSKATAICKQRNLPLFTSSCSAYQDYSVYNKKTKQSKRVNTKTSGQSAKMSSGICSPLEDCTVCCANAKIN